MTEAEQEKESGENLRMEYSVVVNYHNDLVKIRFTIAGLYIAAIGFIAGTVFKEDATQAGKVIGSMFACLITVCVWILELRGRTLYQSVAERGREIEHRYWKLTGPDWYKGFFSRQHKVEPTDDEMAYAGTVPEKPEFDCATISWMKGKDLPKCISTRISHSWAFDLLYPITGLGWFIIFVFHFFNF